jgi:signal transduction histidine kinase/phage shock protein PspC (stress-responsive transcriptional regulator)
MIRMPARRGVCDDAAMAIRLEFPRVPRVPRSNDRIVAGVAAGWADRWNVEPTIIRAAVGLLTLAGGIGAALYGLAALASTPPVPRAVATRPPGRRDLRRGLAVLCATAAILVAARALGLWPGDSIMLAAAAVATGVIVVWSRRDERQPGSGRAWAARGLQIAAGVVLLAAGVISLANRTGGLANVGESAGAIAVVVGGLAMFAAPAVGRLLRSLDEERAMRIREDERAAVAAHLHDSVLQSLVLIQRSDDPRRMASLARRQERELRAWLYGAAEPGDPTSLHAAIDALTVEIEADHDIRVEAVVVGDQPLDAAARTLVGALREALVNAARHADVDRVDVFVEADVAELTGFVRDTGRGFDPAVVPDDRRGISDSILGRLQRAGGVAVLHSQPGVGTEIELHVPRSRR